jgi:hypothetical protein
MDEYAIIKIKKAICIIPLSLLYKYIPIEVISEGMRRGKSWKRNRDQNRRASEKYESQTNP